MSFMRIGRLAMASLLQVAGIRRIQMKKNAHDKKLKLNAETLVTLTSAALANALGGAGARMSSSSELTQDDPVFCPTIARL
jgi:hypothetical protein